MADTTFSAGTVVTSAWAQDVNNATYRGTAVFLAAGTGAVTRNTQDKLREIVTTEDRPGVLGVANTGVGNSVLSAISTGFGNTALGYHALKSITTPGYSTAVGAYALENADQPSNVNLICTAVGAYALNANLSGGQYNVAVGGYSQQFNTTGFFNTTVGTNSGTQNTTGNNNTHVGYNAGNSLAGASNFNTTLGAFAGSSSTLAVGMTLLGYNTGVNNLTGNYLTAVGYAAGSQSTGGLGVAVGKQAGYSFTSNTGWVAVGYEAALNVGGGNVTAIGHQAMGGASSFNNTSSTALGYRAGYANAASYVNSTAIGSNSTNTRDNQFVLGDTSITEVRTSGQVVQKLSGTVNLDNNLEFGITRTDDTHIVLRMKGSDGVVRTSTIVLA